MQKLIVFNQLSLDGYFVDAHGDMSWAKEGPDEEFDAFTSENARGGGVLLFGRKTYELMASFWPTPEARAMLPEVAERMNALPKVVFSRTMKSAGWANARIARDPVAEIRRMKAEDGPGLAMMGSGSIVSLLAPTGLIDEYQLVLIPVVLGAGRTMFEGAGERLPMKLVRSRTFGNGKVFLSYAPA